MLKAITSMMRPWIVSISPWTYHFTVICRCWFKQTKFSLLAPGMQEQHSGPGSPCSSFPGLRGADGFHPWFCSLPCYIPVPSCGLLGLEHFFLPVLLLTSSWCNKLLPNSCYSFPYTGKYELKMYFFSFFILVFMGEDNSLLNTKTDQNGNIVIINNKNCTLGDGNKWNNAASNTYFKEKNSKTHCQQGCLSFLFLKKWFQSYLAKTMKKCTRETQQCTTTIHYLCIVLEGCFRKKIT